MPDCIHLADYAGEKCAGCGDEIDAYGNTENDFNSCSFPDCGCDGARLCMAPSGASEQSARYNVEGMYRLKDPRPRMAFAGAFYSGEFAKAIEARSGETERLDPQDESAGRQALPKDTGHA